MRLAIALALAAVTAVSLVHPTLWGLVPVAVLAVLAYYLHRLLNRVDRQHSAQNALLHTVLRRFPFPVLVTDPAGDVQSANPAALDLLGWPAGTPVVAAALRLHTPDGRQVNLRALALNGSDTCEARLTRPDGTTSEILIESIPIDPGAGTVFALLDISAQRVFEESLHHAAYHDALTGLPNRAMLWQHLNTAAADHHPYAVLLVDLDDFRTVNDTHGHQAGDELLTAVAHRIRDAAYAETRTTPHRAVVARLGSDEFAVLLPGADTRQANHLAQTLRATFDHPFPTTAGRLVARARVGVSVSAPGAYPDEALTDADAAMR
ncbi:diguanylate cyclase domain-containing protein [Dactylosporangium sp. NPDC051541]|uniref:diguanylate cyclase domain-containing protein n=1 Tax=Dactylosporangium sp. NPDC051541 TaxID=3363977 RepID=UPI0037B1229B